MARNLHKHRLLHKSAVLHSSFYPTHSSLLPYPCQCWSLTKTIEYNVQFVSFRTKFVVTYKLSYETLHAPSLSYSKDPIRIEPQVTAVLYQMINIAHIGKVSSEFSKVTVNDLWVMFKLESVQIELTFWYNFHAKVAFYGALRTLRTVVKFCASILGINSTRL